MKTLLFPCSLFYLLFGQPAPPLPLRVPPPLATDFPSIHELQISPPAPLLPNEAINAFGQPAGGVRPEKENNKTLAQATEPPLSLEEVATRLKFQGIGSDQEVIINTYLLSVGGKLEVKFGQESVTLVIKEIRNDAALISWNRSSATFLLQFPLLPDPVNLPDSPSGSSERNQIVLSPLPPVFTGEVARHPGSLFPNRSNPD